MWERIQFCETCMCIHGTRVGGEGTCSGHMVHFYYYTISTFENIIKLRVEMLPLRMADPSFIQWPLPSPCVLLLVHLVIIYSVCINFDAERVHIERCTFHYTDFHWITHRQIIPGPSNHRWQ